MTTPVTAQEEERQIRELVDAWGRASCSGDLAAQMNMMTEDVVFLTAGGMPTRRDEFAERYRAMINQVALEVRSNPQEITVTGDVAVLWNLLEVNITPLAGGETMKRAGNTLTVLRRGGDGRWRIWRDANMLAPA
jgi:uncharacterized protein (TIGR02246 family)